MSLRSKRVLIGRLFHESHSFNVRPTTEECFQVERGPELLASSASVLAGIAWKLQRLGHSPITSVSAVAPPGGLVDHCFYLAIKAELTRAAEETNPDAIALELHGAMATTRIADVEGDLLARLRDAVGWRIPIGIGLDLHGHVTPAMLQAVDICIACKENPHSDLFECGERVVECLDAVLQDRLRPVSSLVKVPMILTGAAETDSGPLAELHRQARDAVAAEAALWDVSIFNVYPFADDVGMGQAVVALADDDPAVAVRISETLGDLLWRWRERFVDDFPAIDRALDLVAACPEQRPFAIADMGDRVLAGAPGDSTAILAAAISRGDGLKGTIPITDPESAAAAISSGLGSRVTLRVGGKFTPGFHPLEVTGEVVSVTDGRFEIRGPFQAGDSTSFGPTAVLKVGALSLILTSRPGFTQDVNAFESQGIDIAAQDFLVIKSGYHFKISFQGVATPLVAETPGISRYRPGRFSWSRGRIHPVHDVGFSRAGATLFDHRRANSDAVLVRQCRGYYSAEKA